MLEVTKEPLAPDQLLKQLESQSENCGAVVSFTGKMRELGETGKPLKSLYLEHYPLMTEASLNRILSQAKELFEVADILLCHRTGFIYKDEPIVFVGVLSTHRKAAFECAMMVMDYLKNEAPFWKKEIYIDGEEVWVSQKQTDRQSYQQWQKKPVR